MKATPDTKIDDVELIAIQKTLNALAVLSGAQQLSVLSYLCKRIAQKEFNKTNLYYNSPNRQMTSELFKDLIARQKGFPT